MDIKQILARLEAIKRDDSDLDVGTLIDRLILDIEIDCRREGVSLVDC